MATMSLSALGETSGVVVRGVARLALEYSNAEVPKNKSQLAIRHARERIEHVPAHGVSLKAFKLSRTATEGRWKLNL